jgi:hypothetical protein
MARAACTKIVYRTRLGTRVGLFDLVVLFTLGGAISGGNSMAITIVGPNNSEKCWIYQVVNGERWANNEYFWGRTRTAKNCSSVKTAHHLSTQHLQLTMIRLSIDFPSKTAEIIAKKT